MPNNIDERVVQMRFDNKQFEQGVAESLKTLDKLKESLKLEDTSKSLLHLDKVISSIGFDNMENGINRVANAFTPFGRVAFKTLDRIADKAVDTGKKLIGMLTGFNDMVAGKAKYEMETKAVQTITNATGKSVHEVESVLSKLMHYTDETSYDFAQMASSIGKFTSVGVDLELAEEAMEGIANWAAKSGADKQMANRAMYNISQAMGTGSMMIRDWMSIENANMATQEFKETAIETAKALGYLQDAGKGVGITAKGIAVNYQTFRETLRYGWLTSDVLAETLRQYGDQTTQFGLDAYHAAQNALTFTDAIDAVRDSVSSGWMTTMKLLFGNLDEARVFWTDLATWMQEFAAIFSDARNNLLESWHNLGGYKAFIESITNVWNSFENVVLGVREALQRVFPPLWAENVVKYTEKVRDATISLREFFGVDKWGDVERDVEELDDATERIKNNLKLGDKGEEVKELVEALKKAGYGDNLAGDIYNKTVSKAIKKLQKDLHVNVTGEWDEATKEAVKANKTFESAVKYTVEETVQTDFLSKAMSRIQEIVEGVASALKIVLSFLKGGFDIAKSYISIFSPVIDLVARIGAMFGQMFKNLSDDIEKGGAITEFVNSIIIVFEPLAEAIQNVTQFFHDFINMYAYALRETNRENTFGNFFLFLLNYLKRDTILAPIVSIVETIINTISYAASTIFGIISNTISIISGALVDLLGLQANNGAYEESGLIVFLNTVRNIAYIAAQAISGFIDVAKNVIGIAVSTITSIGGPAIQTIISLIIQFVYTVMDNLPEITSLLAKLSPIITAIVMTIIYVRKTRGPIAGLKMSLLSLIGVFGFFIATANYEKIKTFFTSLIGYLKEFKTVQNIGKLINEKIVPGIREILSLDSDKKLTIFERLKTALTNIASIILKTAKKIGTDFVTLFFPTEAQRNSDTENTFFKRLQSRYGFILTWLGGIVEDIRSVVGKIWDSLFNLEPPEGGNVPNSLLGQALEGIKNLFKSVAQAAQSILDSGYVSTIITGMFAAGLLNMGRGIRKFSENLEGTILALKGRTVKDTFGTAALKFAGAVAIISTAMLILSKISFDKDSDKVINGLEAFETVVLVMLGAVAALKLMNKYLNDGSTAEKRKSTTNGIFEFAASIAAIGAGLLLIQKFLNNGKNVGSSLLLLSGILVSLIAVQFVMLKITQKSGRRELSAATEGIFDLCKGVLAIAGAIMLLSLMTAINYTGVIRATIIIGAVLLELGVLASAMIWLASKNPKGSVDASIKGITGMCVGMLAIAGAIMMLTATFAIGGSHALTAFWTMEGLIITLGVIAVLMTRFASKNKKGSAIASVGGIVAMCAGMIVIAEAVGKLTSLIDKYGGEDVGGAFAIMVAIIVALGAFTTFMLKNCNDAGWSKMASSMIPLVGLVLGVWAVVAIMADGLKKVKDVDPETLASFLSGISKVLLVMGGIGIALVALKANLKTMIQVALGIAAIMSGIGLGLWALLQLGASAIDSASGSLWLLGVRLESFSNTVAGINWTAIYKVYDFITIDLGIMVQRLIGINFNAALDKATLLVRLGADLALYAGNLSGIKNIETLGQSSKKLIDGAKYVADTAATMSIPAIISNSQLSLLGAELGQYGDSLSIVSPDKLVNSLAVANNAKTVSDIVNSISIGTGISESLTNFGAAIKLYYAAVAGAGLDEDGNPIEVNENAEINPELLRQIMDGLAKSIDPESINEISSFAEGQENDMTKTALGISAIGTALSTYATDIKGISPTDVATANNVLDKVADVYAKLDGSNLKEDQDYIGELQRDNKLGLFADGIRSLGSALGDYATKIGGIKADDVKAANDVLDKVTELDKYLNSSNTDTYIDIDGMHKAIPEKSVIESFSGQLVSLGSGIRSYCLSTDGVTDQMLTTAERVLKFVVGIQNELPKTGLSFASIFTGEKSLSNFSEGLQALGSGIAEYVNALGDVTITDEDIKSFDGVVLLAEAAARLGKSGGLESLINGNFSWSILTSGIEELGPALKSFEESIKNSQFKASDIEDSLIAVERLGTFLNAVQALYTSNIGFKTDMFDPLATSLGTLFERLSNTFLQTYYTDKLEELKEFGKSLMNAISIGTQEPDIDTGLNPITNSIATIIQSTIDLLNAEYIGEFKSVGINLIQGLANGIKEQIQTVTNASSEMGDAILNEVTLKFEVHSPSKKFEWIAQMCALGLANGFEKYSYLVKDAAAITADGSIDTIMAAFDSEKVKEIGSGALGAIQQLLFTGHKDTPYSEKEFNIIKQMLVGTGYLAKDSIEDIEKVKKSIIDFKKDVLYDEDYNGPMNGEWGYEESLKLYQRTFESLYQNGNKGYTKLEYETELMNKLGVESKSATEQIIESNERLAESVETVADMYATLNEEQKKMVDESEDTDFWTNALYWSNIGDELFEKYGSSTNYKYDYYHGNKGGINWDSELNDYFSFNGFGGGFNGIDSIFGGLMDKLNGADLFGGEGLFSGLFEEGGLISQFKDKLLSENGILSGLKDNIIGLFTGEGGIFAGIEGSLFGEGGLLSTAGNKVVDFFKNLFSPEGELAQSLNSTPIDVPIRPVMNMNDPLGLINTGDPYSVLSINATNLTADLSTDAAQIIGAYSSAETAKLDEMKAQLEALVDSGAASKQAIDTLNTRMAEYAREMKHTNIYLDTNKLVGYMSPSLDRSMGLNVKQVNRMQK